MLDQTTLLNEVLCATLWAHKEADLEIKPGELSTVLIEAADDLPGLDNRDGPDNDPSLPKVAFSQGSIGAFAAEHRKISRDLKSDSGDWLRWHEFDTALKDVTEDEIREGAAVVLRHRYLEAYFIHLLDEWAYDVAAGKPLKARSNLDYVADVHGKLQNLHGDYEVCINLVCDRGVNTPRFVYLMNRAADYGVASFERSVQSTDGPGGGASGLDSTFGDRDVFLMVTPFTFNDETRSMAGLYEKMCRFKIVLLQSSHLEDLAKKDNEDEVLEELRGILSR